MRIDRVLKLHRGDHRRVAKGLQFHVATGLCALEFNDDQVGAGVNAEQIDPTLGVLPVAELLGENHRYGSWRDGVDVLSKDPLDVVSFSKTQGSKRRGGNLLHPACSELVDGRHLVRLAEMGRLDQGAGVEAMAAGLRGDSCDS